MVEREFRDFIIDMIEAADMVASFIQGMNKEQFLADKKTQFAVVRALEIIGEAAKKRFRIQYAPVTQIYLGGRSAV